ncbi:hypothetical protein HPB50_011421 [Hyalomma asiaticum]|uniref:Uncharacterized protein n=1 Tax=Hyalomma asiaticum TaxID=266040 RepID=A0ACB7T4C3_HYAAI|nr:hypothetical protein HPB50_011421 [Hyalomma asiaticum]
MPKRKRIGNDHCNDAELHGRYLRRCPRPSQLPATLQLPQWHRVELQPLENDFHREHEDAARRSADEVDHIRKTGGITMKRDDVADPILCAEEAILPDSVRKAIEAQNLRTLTTAQVQCWPLALQGRDLMVTAPNTAEGKVLAYLVPAVVHIINQPPVQPDEGPVAVVLTAERESARQIQQAASKFETCTGVRSTCVISRKVDEDVNESSNELCVATPGRLLSLLQQGKMKLLRCTFLVLDDVNCMWTYGLKQQLLQLLNHLRPDRQTLVWGAPPLLMDARALAMEFCSQGPVEVAIEPSHLNSSDQVRHVVRVCENAEKNDAFGAICEEIFDEKRKGVGKEKVIVFADSAQTVDDLTRMIRRYSRCVIGVHGQQADANREWAVNAFRTGWYTVLVATSSTARCLNLLGRVEYVVNYDYPAGPGKYINRAGTATLALYTIFTPRNSRHAEELISILEASKQDVSPELKNMRS